MAREFGGYGPTELRADPRGPVSRFWRDQIQPRVDYLYHNDALNTVSELALGTRYDAPATPENVATAALAMTPLGRVSKVGSPIKKGASVGFKALRESPRVQKSMTALQNKLTASLNVAKEAASNSGYPEEVRKQAAKIADGLRRKLSKTSLAQAKNDRVQAEIIRLGTSASGYFQAMSSKVVSRAPGMSKFAAKTEWLNKTAAAGGQLTPLQHLRRHVGNNLGKYVLGSTLPFALGVVGAVVTSAHENQVNKQLTEEAMERAVTANKVESRRKEREASLTLMSEMSDAAQVRDWVGGQAHRLKEAQRATTNETEKIALGQMYGQLMQETFELPLVQQRLDEVKRDPQKVYDVLVSYQTPETEDLRRRATSESIPEEQRHQMYLDAFDRLPLDVRVGRALSDE